MWRKIHRRSRSAPSKWHDVVERHVGDRGGPSSDDLLRIGLRVVQIRHILACRALPKPPPFYVGQMPNQTQEREGRRRHRTLPQLLGGQSGALDEKCLPLAVEPLLECSPFCGDLVRIDPLNCGAVHSCVTSANGTCVVSRSAVANPNHTPASASTDSGM